MKKHKITPQEMKFVVLLSEGLCEELGSLAEPHHELPSPRVFTCDPSCTVLVRSSAEFPGWELPGGYLCVRSRSRRRSRSRSMSMGMSRGMSMSRS